MTESTPDTTDTRLRARAFLHAQFTLVLAVLLVCAGVGGAAAYTAHVDPGTETVERPTTSWSVSSEHAHSADVVRDTPVFDQGDTLTDRDTYFATVTPVLDVSLAASYQAPASEDVTVETESVLVVRNAAENTVYWEDRETLATRTVTDVEPGETVRTNFSVNVTALSQRIDRIESDLGTAPGETEALVVSRVTVDGEVAGERVEDVQPVELGIAPGGDTYGVDDAGGQTEQIDRTVTEQTPRSYGPARSVGGPLLFLVGVAGSGALAYARREQLLAVSRAERTWLDYRDDRTEYAEWITRVELPSDLTGTSAGQAESLGDLVDFAIDNDVGVVEDPSTGRYHALVDGRLYTYVPPTPENGPRVASTEPGRQDGDSASPGDADGSDEPSPDQRSGS
ncbi:DUF5305 domain-containing protein [Haloparvum sedimenti]|uniref:DUF5305 domain-containing protein n=1 Tax=Haloparvum sedimenti TaxID=1678448 RepID=UPI00071E8D84|nr:DUF5305 domain-containing protein [Haloparvum sedimenti]